jgi:hypothetical protein
MEKLTSLPTPELFASTYKDHVLYVAKADENVIVTNNGEWMPVTKHSAELAAKTTEIETLKSQLELTTTENKKLVKEFKDVDGFKERVDKLEAEKSEALRTLESTKKSYTIKEAVKDAYRDLGVQAKYLDYVISKEHPEIDKVELKDGKFVIAEDKIKTLKDNYKEVIGTVTVKGFVPGNGKVNDDNEPSSFAEEFKDKFH